MIVKNGPVRPAWQIFIEVLQESRFNRQFATARRPDRHAVRSPAATRSPRRSARARRRLVQTATRTTPLNRALQAALTEAGVRGGDRAWLRSIREAPWLRYPWGQPRNHRHDERENQRHEQPRSQPDAGLADGVDAAIAFRACRGQRASGDRSGWVFRSACRGRCF